MRPADLVALAAAIKSWGRELGFQAVGIADTDLSAVEPRLAAWLAAGFAAELDYMRKHGAKRTRPASLVPGTLRIISARMDYRPDAAGVFADSAPVMEVELARKAGLGWRGKHTLLIAREAGSFFFLGDLYTDLPLPLDVPVEEHCGSCRKCLDVCPTQAIVAPYTLDARRCISYLTIELKGSIPVELRPLIGNRVFGCDDCQLVCPWNRYAQVTPEADFRVRNGLDDVELVDLFAWNETHFRERMSGSAILRVGYERWLRNLAVGLGNAPTSERVVAALRSRAQDASALVREHVAWALERHGIG